MLDQLARLERRFLEIESLLATQAIAAQPREFQRLSQERAELEELVTTYGKLEKVLEDLRGARELRTTESGEMREMAIAECQRLEEEEQNIRRFISILLIPKDPNDGKNIFLEIRAGAGGDEASLFAAELFRAYCRYADGRRWRVQLMSESENELGGTKEVIALIEGDNVYQTLKYERGVHRVQRVPKTETQGRVHTSTVTVAVLPEVADVDVKIDEKDLRIDTYRAGGAGGQHINRTDSAVRITHIPSGIVVACQDERSQIKNKSKAMKILQAKLIEAAEEEKAQSFSAERKQQVGRGDRSERIRTYNFPQSRITDHRINYTTHAISAFMEGEMTDMFNALRAHSDAEALKGQGLGPGLTDGKG